MHGLEVNTPATALRHGKAWQQNDPCAVSERRNSERFRDFWEEGKALSPWHSCTHRSGSCTALTLSCEAPDTRRELWLAGNPLQPPIANLSPWGKAAALTYSTVNLCNSTNKSVRLYKYTDFDYIEEKALMPSLASISSWLQVGLSTLSNITHKLLVSVFNSLVFQQAELTPCHPSSFPTEVFGIFVERAGKKKSLLLQS